MEKVDLGKYQPNCILAHELVNKLSVIVGHCDLLTEHVSEDARLLKRLLTIREIAKSMAKDLNDHQCHLDAMAKAAARRPAQTQAVTVETKLV